MPLINTVEAMLMPLIYRNLVPDVLVRLGIRLLCGAHDRQLMHGGDSAAVREAEAAHAAELRTLPIAVQQKAANDQHYEVPPELFYLMLGPRLKYSGGLWKGPSTSFAQSEEDMLALYCERAGVEDGMSVLDMGCGWGSVSLYVAEHFPNCKVTGVSNSAPQRLAILARAKERGLSNVTIVTGDINVFDFDKKAQFDRVITIEMMEHMKNYELLLGKVSTWIKPGGALFIHIFTHVTTPYHFVDGWMAEEFFTGGQMPSDTLLCYFQKHLRLEGHWRVNGTHYEKTSNAWLEALDRNKASAMAILEKTMGSYHKANVQFVKWRLFYLACAELFGYDRGNRWIVSHYLMRKPE